MASVLSMRSALGGSNMLAAPKATRSGARAARGVKVFARMTKDRVKLDKDSKWRETIDIYPVNNPPPPRRCSPAIQPSAGNGASGFRGEFVKKPVCTSVYLYRSRCWRH
jgi:hypothetical protein